MGKGTETEGKEEIWNKEDCLGLIHKWKAFGLPFSLFLCLVSCSGLLFCWKAATSSCITWSPSQSMTYMEMRSYVKSGDAELRGTQATLRGGEPAEGE